MTLDEMKEERDKLFKEMVMYDPTTSEYERLLKNFNILSDRIHEAEETDANSEKFKKEQELKWAQLRKDDRVQTDATRQKEKESKRGLIRTILTVFGCLLGTVITIFAEETRIIGSKAWGLLSKYPKQ